MYHSGSYASNNKKQAQKIEQILLNPLFIASPGMITISVCLLEAIKFAKKYLENAQMAEKNNQNENENVQQSILVAILETVLTFILIAAILYALFIYLK